MLAFVNTPVSLPDGSTFVLHYADGWLAMLGNGSPTSVQRIIPSFDLPSFMAEHNIECADVLIDVDAARAAYDTAHPTPKQAPYRPYNNWF